jgi:hypothetical protein
MTDTVHGTPRTDVSAKTAPQLVSDVSRLVPQLAREEIALAKAELAEKGKQAGLGGGLLGAAGITGLFAAAVLIAAAVIGLAEAVPAWAAALIVAAVLLAVAGILALLGRSHVSRATPPVPELAAESTRQDVETMKESARR